MSGLLISVLFAISFIGILDVYNRRQINTVLQISMKNLSESLKVGDWVLIQKNIEFNVQGSDIYSVKVVTPSGQTLVGPLGDTKSGLFEFCNSMNDSSTELSLQGCIKRLSVQDIISLFSITVITGFLFVFLFLSSKKRINSVVTEIESSLNYISETKTYDDLLKFNDKEIIELERLFLKIRQLLLDGEMHARESTIIEIAKQVAHDIRSPLSVINLVAPSVRSVMPTEQSELLIQAAARIEQISNDLLKSNKTTAKQNLPESLRQIVMEKKVILAVTRKISIEIHSSIKESDQINIPTADVMRIFSNLLNNSIEAIGENSEGLIKINLNECNGYIVVEIMDNGIGMPDAVLSKLGIKGYSFGKAENKFDSGSGLGVYHAKKILANFDGKLEFESVDGVGTTVRIFLKLIV